METIQNSLSEILERRKQEKEEFEVTCKRIYRIRQFVDYVEGLQNDSTWKLLLRNSSNLKNDWENFLTRFYDSHFCDMVKDVIDIRKTSENKYILQGSLKLIWDRIRRDFIRIGVMGTISSGKSSLLQSLTGLDDNVIPTGQNKCTATRTRFIHSDEKIAVVYFRTQDNLKDVLIKHIDLLNLYYINNKQNSNKQLKIATDNHTIDDIISILKEQDHQYFITPQGYDEAGIIIQTGQNPTSGFARGYCETLKDFVDNYDEYKKLLINKTPLVIEEKEINAGMLKPYVSYVPGKPYCYAVEKVEVKCPLSGGELKGIELVDTMGIGEPKVGVEEELTETLKNEVDIAIALYRVKATDTYDEKSNSRIFHQRIKDGTKRENDRKPEQWIYYLLNIEGNVTNEITKEFKKKIADNLKPIKLPESAWGNASVLDAKSINNYFINTVLGNLKQSIIDIDRTFMKEANDKIKTIENNYFTLFNYFSDLSIPKLNYEKHIDNKINEKFRIASTIATNKRLVETKNKKEYNEIIKKDIKEELERCFPVKEYVKKESGKISIESNDVDDFIAAHIAGTKQNGRELEIFWRIREYIVEQMENVLISFKSNWFFLESVRRKNEMAATLYYEDQEFKDFISPLSGMGWLSVLAKKMEDDDFDKFYNGFSDLQLEVVSRIKHQFANIYKDIILDINLVYKDEKEAVDSISTRLSIIQKKFQTEILNYFDKIFNEEFDIFNPIMSYFLNNLIYYDGGISTTIARKALERFLRKNFDNIYKTDDFKQMQSAIDMYNDALKKLSQESYS